MTLSQFLLQLWHSGRVRVPDPQVPSPSEWPEAVEELRRFEQHARSELPGQPPPLDERYAIWAAWQFYLAAQFLTHRDVDEEIVRGALTPRPDSTQGSAAAPQAIATPAMHYSVDLVFRYLPDLYRLAVAASRTDPLVDCLLGWGAAWPLSSVGMPRLPLIDLDGILHDASLATMYVDRIIARRDITRLQDPRVRELVRSALGLHASLAPEIAAACERIDREATAAAS